MQRGSSELAFAGEAWRVGARRAQEGDGGKVAPHLHHQACLARSILEVGHLDESFGGHFPFSFSFFPFSLPSCLLSSLLPFCLFSLPLSLLCFPVVPSPFLWLSLSLPTPSPGTLSSPLFLSVGWTQW